MGPTCSVYPLSAPGGGEGWGEVGDSREDPLIPTSPSHACGVGPSLSALKGGEGFNGLPTVLQLDIGRDVFRLDPVDRQPAIEPFANLLDAAIVIDPGVQEVAPVLVRLLAHAHAGRQLDARLVQHLEFAERGVLLDRG